MKPQIAVLVINYNGEKYLPECFESLINSGAEKWADLFLVDNSSKDRSVRETQRQFPSVSIIQTGANAGFTGAYNFADNFLTKSGKEYEYYFFLNNDTRTDDPGLLPTLQGILEADHSVGIVTPTILAPDGKIRYQGGDFMLWTGTTLDYRSGADYTPVKREVNSKWATGCALFMRAKLFRSVGQFEDYFMYQEDVSLSWKVMLQGLRVITDCSTSVVHYGGGTEKSSDFEHYWAERNRLLLYWQHFSAVGTLTRFLPLLLIRIVMLARCRSTGEAGAKVKAIWAALILLGQFPKRSHSTRQDRLLADSLHTRMEQL